MSVIKRNHYLKLIPYPITENTLILKLIMTWTSDDDIDDTVENILDCIKITDYDKFIKIVRLNYKFMNEILLDYHYNIKSIIDMYRKYNNKIKSYIQEVITYIKQTQTKELIKKIFNIYADLIKIMYNNYFTSFKTIYTYFHETKQLINVTKFIVFRGFNYDRYKLLLNKTKKININDNFNTGCFLSSSVYESIAIKFVSKNEEDIENRIIWKINVNPDKYKKFYFAYLSNESYSINDFSIIDCNEVEILLNMNMLLQLKNKYIKNNYMYYEWDFIDYIGLDDIFFTNFNRFINQIFNFIDLREKLII